MKSFASDNHSGVANEMIDAIVAANVGHQPAYGEDPMTTEALQLIRDELGAKGPVFFVYNGTAANTLALKSILRSHESIICTESAHIVNHEVGAPTAYTGSSCLSTPHKNGKITPEAIKKRHSEETKWGHHATLPRVVSVTQPTELGTLYTIEEMSQIAEICRQLNLVFHMDGCRIYNAAVSLKRSLREITRDVGVDVLSLGGTKNGLMFGEAVVFFNQSLSKDFSYIHKQGLQLHSKMRYISAQFIPFFKDRLWHKYASRANDMCQYLAEKLAQRGISTFEYPVETNQIFVSLPKETLSRAQEQMPFYCFNEESGLARLVASFDTEKEEVDRFVEIL